MRPVPPSIADGRSGGRPAAFLPSVSDAATTRDVAGHLATMMDRLACPSCCCALELDGSKLECTACHSTYTIDGVAADLRPPGREEVQGDASAWAQHWSKENQKSLSQRFFSVYRRLVFARTVGYFANRYFPAHGVLVEAGSGTSETSRRIDKHGGARKLVAVDLLLPVLARCDSVMDVCLGGDIFRLPFTDASVEGIWNVGVMEHFTHAQIDRILSEFHRVLRPGGRVIMLWPGTDSLPQKLLRLAEAVINMNRGRHHFRFHPPEISLLESARHGRAVLSRNGFDTVTIDSGVYSLLAFKTVVGEKADRPVPQAIGLKRIWPRSQASPIPSSTVQGRAGGTLER